MQTQLSIENLEEKVNRKRILVADDEPAIIKLYKDILEDYEVYSALNGEEALEIYQELQKNGNIDLIISDITMKKEDDLLPRMNGYELAEKIRAINPETKILLSSGDGDFADKAEALLEHGKIRGYLRKPARFNKIKEAIECVLAGFLYTDPLEESF